MAQDKEEEIKYTINVDLAIKCKRCGKGGAVNPSGVCMACIAKAVKNGEFDNIIKNIGLRNPVGRIK